MWKWTRVLSTPSTGNQNGSSDPLIVGPTYKVDVIVDGVKTRAVRPWLASNYSSPTVITDGEGETAMVYG